MLNYDALKIDKWLSNKDWTLSSLSENSNASNIKSFHVMLS